MSIELITLSCNLKSNSRPNTITFCPKTCPVREHSWRRWTRMATFARPAIMEPLWYLNRETLGDARGKANFPSIGRKTIPRTDEKIHFIARRCTICAAHARRSHISVWRSCHRAFNVSWTFGAEGGIHVTSNFVARMTIDLLTFDQTDGWQGLAALLISSPVCNLR